MADDSTVQYEPNEYKILEENVAPNVEQIYVIANEDGDEQFDGKCSIESYNKFIAKGFHVFLSLVCSRNLLGRGPNRRWNKLVDNCSLWYLWSWIRWNCRTKWTYWTALQANRMFKLFAKICWWSGICLPHIYGKVQKYTSQIEISMSYVQRKSFRFHGCTERTYAKRTSMFV